MDKKTKKVLLLIFLIFFLANYLLYIRIISLKIDNLNSSKMKYAENEERIEKYIQSKGKLDKIEAEIEELSEKTAQLNKLTVYNIDTPQLIYEFYNYCNEYGVYGDIIEFQLKENSDSSNNQTDQTSNTLNNTNANDTQNETNKSSQISLKGNNEIQGEKLLKLSIDLSVYCTPAKLDAYLGNLNKITSRMLNVEVIDIVKVSENNDMINDTSNLKNGDLKVDIKFSHYLIDDGKYHTNDNNYEFFDAKVGFDKIGDMFK